MRARGDTFRLLRKGKGVTSVEYRPEPVEGGFPAEGRDST
jgi:hypothetical protein